MTLSCLVALGRGGLHPSLIKARIYLDIFNTATHARCRIYNESEHQWNWHLPECWDKGVLLPSAYDYPVYMCIYKPMRFPCQRQPALYSQWGKKKTFGEDAHTFGSSPAQQILPKKLNGVFVLARSSVHSILAPVNLLSWVICAPQSWLILSPSRRRAALAVALRAPVLQECRGTSGRPLLTFSLWVSSHIQYLQEQKCSK